MKILLLWLLIGLLVLIGAFMIHPLLGSILLLIVIASIWGYINELNEG